MEDEPIVYVRKQTRFRRTLKGRLIRSAVAGITAAAGTAVIVYACKYKTMTVCHITPEQIELLKKSSENAICYAFDTRHRVMVTMHELPK